MKYRRMVLLLSGFLLCAVMLHIPGCEKKPTETEDGFNEDLYDLRLTELHYNPARWNDVPGDSLEFIELKNTGSTELALGSLEITDGVAYVFPEDAVVEEGEFYVVAINASAFEKVYGFAPDGEYTGVLNNGGEVITIKDLEFNEVIVNQPYADTDPWPEQPDGEGYSLVSVSENPSKDSTGAAFWKRSARIGGSPGADETELEVDSTVFDLRITELHYHPMTVDQVDSDSLEFLEIKNVGSQTVNLGSVIVTGGITYSFPGDAELGKGKFIVLAKNKGMVEDFHSSVTVFGEYEGKLSNSGETITLFDIAADTAIVTVDYGTGGQWPESPDGEGYSLVPVKKNPDRDQNVAAAWRQSLTIDGSPGEDDQGVAVISELLTHTDEPQTDAIELYNPGDDEVDVSGWYISDSRANPVKFEIPDDTKIPSGNYIVFDESDFNTGSDSTSSFTFNSHGEEAWLFADERGCAFGYCHGVEFGELENGISIGRHITSEGRERFVPQKEFTPGEKNAGPLIGPLVISEIMYHSVNDDGEYIEITNISDSEMSLSHPELPEHTWKIEGAAFSFPAGVTVKAGESVVVASDSISETSFRARYSVDEDVQVFAMTGVLKNSSETIELRKPEDPYIADSTVATDSLYPYMTFDAVDYSDDPPWPEKADGKGLSLHRSPLASFGDDPKNWVADAPSPGTTESD